MTPLRASPNPSGAQAMSRIQDAPDDVVIQICRHLSVKDILAFRQVSGGWAILAGTHGSLDVQTRVCGVWSQNALGLPVHHSHRRPGDTFPRSGSGRPDVCTRVRDGDPRGSRSKLPLALWISTRRIRAEGDGGMAGEFELSHLRNPFCSRSQRTRGEVHCDGFEGDLVLDQSMGRSSHRPSARGHPESKKSWLVEYERCDLQRHRGESRPPVEGERSRRREFVRVG